MSYTCHFIALFTLLLKQSLILFTDRKEELKQSENLVWILGDEDLQSKFQASREGSFGLVFFIAPGAFLTGVVNYVSTVSPEPLIARVNVQYDIRIMLQIHMESKEDKIKKGKQQL